MITDTKDPSENVTFTFDYTKTGTVPVTAVITITYYSGAADPGVTLVLSGVYQISGAKVLQLIIGGQDKTLYGITCLATMADGQKLMLSCVLPVAIAPVLA